MTAAAAKGGELRYFDADSWRWVLARRYTRGSTIGEGGNTTISSPGRSPKQPPIVELVIHLRLLKNIRSSRTHGVVEQDLRDRTGGKVIVQHILRRQV